MDYLDLTELGDERLEVRRANIFLAPKLNDNKLFICRSYGPQIPSFHWSINMPSLRPWNLQRLKLLEIVEAFCAGAKKEETIEFVRETEIGW
jgi:hypothetical protein